MPTATKSPAGDAAASSPATVLPAGHSLIRRFVEEAGNVTQALGAGRVVGQVYAYLYFSSSPRSLDDLKDWLGISKGSASTSVRQLEQWGAVQRLWIKGDRKDYYTANDYFGRIVRNLMMDVMGQRMTAFAELLEHAERSLGQPAGSEVSLPVGEGHASVEAEQRFLRDRLQRLRQFQDKIQGVWSNPIVRLMMK